MWSEGWSPQRGPGRSDLSEGEIAQPHNTTTTTTVLWPVVRYYTGELVPEETLTHPPS